MFKVQNNVAMSANQNHETKNIPNKITMAKLEMPSDSVHFGKSSNTILHPLPEIVQNKMWRLLRMHDEKINKPSVFFLKDNKVIHNYKDKNGRLTFIISSINKDLKEDSILFYVLDPKTKQLSIKKETKNEGITRALDYTKDKKALKSEYKKIMDYIDDSVEYIKNYDRNAIEAERTLHNLKKNEINTPDGFFENILILFKDQVAKIKKNAS